MSSQRWLPRAASGCGTVYRVTTMFHNRPKTDALRTHDAEVYQQLLDSLQVLFCVQVLYWRMGSNGFLLILFVPAIAPDEKEAQKRCTNYYQDKPKKHQYSGEKLRDLSFFMFMLNRIFTYRRGEFTGQLWAGGVWQNRYYSKVVDPYQLPMDLSETSKEELRVKLSKVGIPQRKPPAIIDIYPWDAGGKVEGRRCFVRKTTKSAGYDPSKTRWCPHHKTKEELLQLIELRRQRNNSWDAPGRPRSTTNGLIMSVEARLILDLVDGVWDLLYDCRDRWFRQRRQSEDEHADSSPEDG